MCMLLRLFDRMEQKLKMSKFVTAEVYRWVDVNIVFTVTYHTLLMLGSLVVFVWYGQCLLLAMCTVVSLWWVVQKIKPHPGKPVMSVTWMKYAGKTSIKYCQQNSALHQIVFFRGFSTVKCFMLSLSVASQGGSVGSDRPGLHHSGGNTLMKV